MTRRRLTVGLGPKLFLVFLLVVLAASVYLGCCVIPLMRSTVWQQVEIKTRGQAGVAWNVVEFWYGLEASGQMSRADAQASALAQVTGLGCGDHGESSFWISDFQPVLLAHSYSSGLVNHNVGSITGPDGQAYFADFASICRSRGEGFCTHDLDYGDDAGGIQPRLCYVKSFEPWGWIVGTGVRSGDAMASYQQAQTRVWYMFGVTFLGALLFWAVAMQLVVVRPLRSLVKRSEALALGDVEQKVDVDSSDEIGTLAASCSKVVDYMNEMADTTSKVAGGDITVDVKLRSEKDAFGKALSHMVSRQRQLIGRVKTAAVSVAEASQQLTRAAEQTSHATQQVTSTMQQVAKGAAEQYTSLQQTAGSVDHLARAISQIAEGSQEQARAVGDAARAVETVSAAIDSVSGNAQAGVQEWESTAESAMGGARKAQETVSGMEKIKKAMDLVSARVMDLGQRSGDIGKIVATIDDIAAQTNMLALNASIEAARAGEQGRGFAVVADEVRKLAEKCSAATKEITTLVKGTQTNVREAVDAMQQSSREVEAGYQLAMDAGGALGDILTRSQNVKRQVEEMAVASQALKDISHEMTESIRSINTIVEENAAASEEMARSSDMVAKAVEATASVSEENSAAAEEMSASTEEMSAQVEEALAAAHSLADTAEDLRKTVGAFKT